MLNLCQLRFIKQHYNKYQGWWVFKQLVKQNYTCRYFNKNIQNILNKNVSIYRNSFRFSLKEYNTPFFFINPDKYFVSL